MNRSTPAARLRILIVALDFPPAIGGIQEWTVQVARQLARRHDVTVIALAQQGAAVYDAQLPFIVHRVPAVPGRAASLVALGMATLATAARIRAEVLLYTHLFAAIGIYPLHRLLPPTVVVTHGCEVEAPGAQRLLPAALTASRGCIAVSTFTAGLLHAKGVPEQRIRVIPNGILGALLEETAPAQHAPASTDRVLLTVARLDERYKGHDTVLRALPLILAKVPQARYVIAGDGAHRGYYERLAAALGVAGQVTFLGRVDETTRLALYDRGDLFVLASRQEVDGSAEGFGIVFLEAAARGKPVVGGRSGGIPDAVEDGITGLLVDPTDPAAVATACTRLLTDPALARRLGEAGRERAAARFTWERVARQVEAVLAEAAGRTGA